MILCLIGSWNLWYTTNCVLEKKRFNMMNPLQVDVLRVNITNIYGCDILDGNFTKQKSLEYLSKLSNEIDNINLKLNLTHQKNLNAAVTIRKVAASFTWLAVVMISFVFIAAIFIDSQRLVSFLMKRKDPLKKVELKKQKITKLVPIDKRSVFRKVTDKDNVLLNHPYFRTHRKFS